MRILVAIAYYGTNNEPHVRRLLEEYAGMRFDVDVVVLSEAPKDLPGVELRIGLPTSNPYSLPFAHKPLFMERARDYDLFIYTEDDTLITEQAIDSFLWATERLPSSNLAGFLRTEKTATGELRCSSVSGRFHWRPGSAFEAGGEAFGEFTNPHAAAYILTQEQLRDAIASGGFAKPTREGRLSMRVTAATDPYTVCGFTKVICLSRLDEFMLPHLSNRYIETDLGIPFEEFRAQADALRRTISGDVSQVRLFNPTVQLDDPRWDKLFYEAVDPAALGAIPEDVSDVLSIGVGSGSPEAPLVARGVTVHGMPLDEIIAISARRRNVRTTVPEFDAAFRSLGGVEIDAMLAQYSLHHFADPIAVLRDLRTCGDPGALIVATFPNVQREFVRRALRRANPLPSHRNAEAAGVHLASMRTYASWFRRSGYVEVKTSYSGHGDGPSAISRFLSPTVQIASKASCVPSARNRATAPRPLVSIGLPVFNGENYIEHALASIKAQDMTDLEVVICDNASTDATEAICRDWASSDERFRYVRHDRNLGAARNYNECFVRSQGQYFTWLAHDDVRAASFLRLCLEAFATADGPTVLAYPRADFIDESGIAQGHDSCSVECRSGSPVSRLAVAVADTSAVNAIFGLIRASALEQTRLIGSFIASDRVLLAELALLGQICEVPEVLSFRRLHREMSTNAYRSKAERTKWFDPDARVPLAGKRQLLAQEYARSVMTLPMSPAERAACLAVIPVRMGGRHARIALGRWRRRLTPSADASDGTTYPRTT